DNATAERLAEQLALRIVAALAERGVVHSLERLTVGIEETQMQAAFYTLDLRRADGMLHERPPG
ncbi:MAG: hypothetical protein ACXVCO_21255, partial [Ktedonobacterales bacterium]